MTEPAAHPGLPHPGRPPFPAARRPPRPVPPAAAGRPHHRAAADLVPRRADGRPAEDPRRDDPRGQDRHRDLREHLLPVVIDGETAAVVPRTTTSEIHRYKANATDKRTQARLT